MPALFLRRMGRSLTLACMVEYRAEFDAEVSFSNGGRLSAEGFRVDVAGPDVEENEIATLFVASLGLLMVDRVQLHRIKVFPESHKATRGGPSEDTGRTPPQEPQPSRLVELSHVISEHMVTYPGLPGPEITPYLTREASRPIYAGGVEFAIDWIKMVGNTGTYLDSPYHRYHDGVDLAGLSLASLADLPAVVVRTVGSRSRQVDVGSLAAYRSRDVLSCCTPGGRALGHTGLRRGRPLSDRGRCPSTDRAQGPPRRHRFGQHRRPRGTSPARPQLAAGRRHSHRGTSHRPRGATSKRRPVHGCSTRVAGFGTFPVRAFATVPA